MQKIHADILTQNKKKCKILSHRTNKKVQVNVKNAPLAQSVEQWTVNPCVAGSNPAGGVKVEESYFDKVPFLF